MGSTLFDSLKYSRLSRRMLLLTVICGLFFILLATAGQLYTSYRNQLDSINSAMQTISEVHIPGIANSFYFLDKEQSHMQMSGALNLAGISYLQISEQGDGGSETIFTQAGDPQVSSKIVQEYPLDYRLPSGEIKRLGKLTVVASLDGVWAQLWWDGLVFLLISTLLIGLVSATIFLIVQLTLTRHLVTLAQFANRLNLEDLSEAPTLEIGASKHAEQDELDQLVTAIVQMRDRIRQDYLERKERQAEYQQILETVSDGFLILDRDLQQLEANKAATSMLGLAANELGTLGAYHSVLSKSPEAVRALIKQITKQGGDPFETQFMRQDGMLLNLEISGSYTAHGDRYFCFLRDITERKRTENALRHSHKMDALGQLTGGIAHDFNNILGIILGYASLLESELSSDAKACRQARSISTSARRGADLTRQLLNFSRSQATLITVINLNRIIKEMDRLIGRSVTPEIEVQYHLAESLWRCKANRGDFEDALVNLILNARDAMPGGGNLTLTTENLSLDSIYCSQNPGVVPGDYVMLEVRDSGEGIPYALHEHIFEPFFTTKPKGKGTGMGLAMVFGFVKRSRGDLKVISEPGKGSRFQIYLPRTEEQEFSSEQIEEVETYNGIGGATLLVVDDEAELLELAQTYLTQAGHRVLTAEDGPRALQLLAQEPDIKLLLTDIVMPGGINGYQLAKQAKTARPDLRILFTSGYADGVSPRKNESGGEQSLLSKPYKQTELIARVRSILNQADS